VAVPDDAPLSVTVAPFPPAAGLIVPETLYVGGGGGLVEFVPATKPEQPQESAAALNSKATRSECRFWAECTEKIPQPWRAFVSSVFIGLSATSCA